MILSCEVGTIEFFCGPDGLEKVSLHEGHRQSQVKESGNREEQVWADWFHAWLADPFLAPPEFPMASALSVFQAQVRMALQQIPAGQVQTYGEVAAVLGKPQAARAVGRACGANPLPIVVPCHRVVSGSGLGGFSAGETWKTWLLRREGVSAAS